MPHTENKEETAVSLVEHAVDEYIGKTVWVDTVGVKGKHFGWCECTIVRKDGEIYIGNCIRWPKHYVEIPDLLDETEVMHMSPIPIQAE